MQIVIDIPQGLKIDFENENWTALTCMEMKDALMEGIPIPDNATNERMVGKWIKSRDIYGMNHFTCPFCEHDIATQYADNWDDNYCSNCGARMEGMEYEKGYIL